MPLFSTWVYLCEGGPTHLNAGLIELAHRLMRDDRNATRRTNCGGWHYAFDLFKLDDPVVAEFRDEMGQHVQAFLNYFRPDGRKKTDRFRLEGWLNVNRAGDHNLLHCHPGCFLSATYYVAVPAGSDLELQFELQADSKLSFATDLVSEMGAKFHAGVSEQTVEAGSRRTVGFRVSVPNGATALESRIHVRADQKAGLTINDFSLTVRAAP